MLEIPKRITLKTARCPRCQSRKSLKRILWGMPTSSLSADKYILGGCCIPESPPEIGCTKCDWSGWRGSIIPKNRTNGEQTIRIQDQYWN